MENKQKILSHWGTQKGANLCLKCTEMRLAARLRPDPLGQLKRSPKPPSRNQGVLLLRGGRGRERGKGMDMAPLTLSPGSASDDDGYNPCEIFGNWHVRIRHFDSFWKLEKGILWTLSFMSRLKFDLELRSFLQHPEPFVYGPVLNWIEK